MPGFDGTGPAGQGSLTGGGRGYCAVPVDNRNRTEGYDNGAAYPYRGLRMRRFLPFGTSRRGRGRRLAGWRWLRGRNF